MKQSFQKANEDFLVRTFLKLAGMESPSYGEKRVIDFVIRRLKAEKLGVTFQRLGPTGNIIARLRGNRKGPALFFNAHTDTVKPCRHVRPVLKNGIIRSDGTTILGADDKAAISIFLAGIRHINRCRLKHPELYFILTCAEEQGLVGAKNLDFSRIRAREGFCFDADGPPGHVILAAATHYQYRILVRGKAAHAGIQPEKGKNAVKIGAELIRMLPSGRLDHETTANVGMVQGGIATNIVPEDACIEGEFRSRNDKKIRLLLSNLRSSVMKVQRKSGARIAFRPVRAYRSYWFSPDSRLVKRFVRSCRDIGVKPRFMKSNGGSDANILNQKGRACLNCGIGMSDVHSPKEFIRVRDLANGLKLFLSIIRNW